MGTSETIAAISTPLGTGGISVIRISGEKTLDILKKIFKGRNSFEKASSHTAHFGTIIDPKSGNAVDQGVFTIFRGPNSYTGEDIVEISCHGGTFVTKMVLQAALHAGARLAEPGEFTKRAFLNGKLDLSQAEAVADIIKARTEKSLLASFRQLSGKLLKTVKSFQKELIELLGLLEIELDFSEERIEFISQEEILTRIDSVKKKLEQLISSYNEGRFLRDGVKMTIVGRPNVGKSSLLNRLVGSERAIVDSTPGTTRDALEVQLDIDGVLFRIIDTAGLRKTKNRIEAKGVEIAQFYLNEADLIIFLFDGSAGWTKEDAFVWEKILTATQKSGSVVLVVKNKIDLLKKDGEANLPALVRELLPIPLSAKTGAGMDTFYKSIQDHIFSDDRLNKNDVILSNVRHVEAMEIAVSALCSAQKSIQNGMSQEFTSLDVREALDALGEIVGETSSEDVLNYIFESFCIGK